MGIPLKVLIVEDSEDDALLILRELRRGGYDPYYERVQTAEEMKASLGNRSWDIVLSDYHMPNFDGINALKLLQEKDSDIPFILVSGLIGEETAVEAMKAGANDYIMKDNLKRLVPAIERELREAVIRHDRRQTRKALKESENLYRAIFENTGTASIIFEDDMIISLANRECEKLSGYSREEVEGRKKWTEFILKDDLAKMIEYHKLRGINPDSAPKNYEFHFVNRAGDIRDVFLTVDVIPGTKKRIASLLDVTERKKSEEALKKSEKELKKRIKELEEFYDIAVGRELRMKELKEEIESLKKELKK
ncbi:MAG: PAS domain S-box protein [Nitrospira sp.]|nr:PAS domain S-box protein [Nitrospira sp.]